MIHLSARRLARSARLVPFVVIGAAILGPLPGCGGDDASDSIRQARIDLDTLAATRGSPVGSKGRQVSYDLIVKNLSKATESSRSGEASAARLLRCRAKGRLAEIKSQEAAELERTTLDRIVNIRAAYDRWLSLNADADALVKYDDKYDPKRLLDDLDKQIAAKEAEVSAATAEEAQETRKIADLQAQAKAKADQAKLEHEAEAKIRQSAVDKTETQREGLLKQATEHRRAGDVFDKEAANLNAEIAKEQPSVAAMKRRIDRLRDQRKLIEDSKTQINQGVAVNTQQAAKSKEAAAALAASIVKWVAELKALRESLAAPSDDAARLYGEAFSEAKSAGSGTQKAAAALAAAAGKHALADMLLTRARGQEAYANLLDLLAGAKPPIPGANLRAEADPAMKAAADLLAQAKEALMAAKVLYETAGGSSEVKDRLQRIAVTLETIATGKAPAPAPKPDDGAAAAPPPAAPAAPAGPEAEVRAMLTQFAADVAGGNIDAVGGYFAAKDDQERAIVDKVVGVMRASKSFDNACVSVFGSDFKTIVAKAPGGNPALAGLAQVSPSDQLLKQLQGQAGDITIKVISETEAEISAKSAPGQSQKVVKSAEGRWQVNLGIPPQQAPMMDPLLTGLSSMYEKMAQNVTSGKYGKDTSKMLTDLQLELVAVMARLGPPPGGPK